MRCIQLTTSKPLNLVFWQPLLSAHLSATVRALAAHPSVSVTMVGMDVLSPELLARWQTVPDFGNATVVEAPTLDEMHHVIRRISDESVHFLTGWKGLRMGWELLHELEKRSARMVLLTEGGDPRNWQGLLRRLVFLKDRLVHGRNFDFVLAMGKQGVTWFRQCGYSAQELFPFAYATEPSSLGHQMPHPAGPFEMVFLGQHIHRKGMDLAFRALAGLDELDWRLTLIGVGSEAKRWKAQCSSLGNIDRVRFLSASPNTVAMQYLAVSDALLLPSRHDGWGAVVNEALMLGVPVICSNRCGAKDLVTKSWRGEVFESGSVESLRAALKRRILAGKRTPEMSQRIAKWSRCLQGDVVAKYLLDVMKHFYSEGPPPAPPWASDFNFIDRPLEGTLAYEPLGNQ